MAAAALAASTVPATRVERLSLGDPRWRAHVEARSDAVPFHHPVWASFLAECYGLDGYTVGFLSGDSVLGGVPLLRTRHLFGRQRLVSLPFADYVPPLAAEGCDFAAALEAERSAARLARIELRGVVPGLQAVDAGYRHVLPLDPDLDALFDRFNAKRVRQIVRRAEREQALTIRRGECEGDLADVFYGLHLATRRRLGVPVQPRRFFRLLWERVIEQGHGWLLLAYADGRPVAGGVFLTGGTTVVYKFGAANRSASRLSPNHALLWHAIRESADRGFRSFDFGRTDPWNAGLRDFKLGWGTLEEPLRYTFAGVGTSKPAEGPGRASRTLAGIIPRSPQWVCRGAGELLYRYAA